MIIPVRIETAPASQPGAAARPVPAAPEPRPARRPERPHAARRCPRGRGWALRLLLACLIAPALPPAAAQTFTCGVDTEYSIDQNTRVIRRLNPVTGATATIATVPAIGNALLNGIGLPPGGGEVIYGVVAGGADKGRVFAYNAATGALTQSPIPAGVPAFASNFVAGGFNPANRLFYSAAPQANTSNNSVWGLFSYDPRSNAVAQAGAITEVSGNNGDLAFDNLGNLYLVSGNSASGSRIYRVTAQQLAAGGNMAASPVTGELGSGGTYPGIAFNDGLLTVGANGAVSQLHPSTGAVSNGPVSTSSGSDLASCGYPYTIRLRKNLPDGRNAAGDQFALSIGGGGWAAGNAATTGGGAGGLQAAVAGPVLGLPGNAYTIGEAASGSAQLGGYATSWTCVNESDGNAAVASGRGASGRFVMPDRDNAGADVLCTFGNEREVDLSVTKTNTPAAGASDRGDDTVRSGAASVYTLAVGNAGPSVADQALLRDTAASGLKDCEVVAGSCSVVGTATCPAPAELSFARLSGGGVRLPPIAAGGGLRFQVRCTVE
ncbi:hypothetical protein SAMN04487939_10592 [Lysobacter sp. yr284]|nr:hypothetical protein SAMN04487939_10592 [Lysobacter sp. yr284]